MHIFLYLSCFHDLVSYFINCLLHSICFFASGPGQVYELHACTGGAAREHTTYGGAESEGAGLLSPEL